MANTSSAKKAVRKLARRTAINRMRRSAMRTQLRKVEEAIASGDAAAARTALTATESVVMRSAQKGIIHANTASRKVSRLSARVKALGAQGRLRSQELRCLAKGVLSRRSFCWRSRVAGRKRVEKSLGFGHDRAAALLPPPRDGPVWHGEPVIAG